MSEEDTLLSPGEHEALDVTFGEFHLLQSI